MAASLPASAQTVPAPAGYAPDRPLELNFYGLPGLMDMPTADAMPDGELTTTISTFGGMTRGTLSFQITPRISGSFRYTGLRNWDYGGFSTYYDRSFDFRFLLLTETDRRPAVTVGIQDFLGTGLYSGEYVVATKTFAEQFSVTGGIGWGRLASEAPFGSIGTRKALTPDEIATGGQLNADTWFRGDMAFFGGFAYRPIEKLTLKAEYSSDAYILEDDKRGIFDRASSLNFGAEYQVSPEIRLGAYAMYGSEIGLTAQFAINPARPATYGSRDTLPPPVLVRPTREESPEFYTTSWTESESVATQVEDLLSEGLRAERMELVALNLSADTAVVYLRNTGYRAPAQAIGRTARVMSRVLPSSIETFTIVQQSEGISLPSVSFQRSDIEVLETAPDGAELMFANAVVDVDPARPARTQFVEGVYPRLTWDFGPYIRTTLFDPDSPLRLDFGLELGATYRPAPGLLFSGAIQKKLVGNLDQITRESDSVLPHVRSDYGLYDQNADPAVKELYGAYYFQPGSELYGRFTAGWVERMHAGVSAEVLWAPYDSNFALGAELNYTQQRDYDGGLGMLDYKVATGHASLYYRFEEDFFAQVDVGRYLAGDYGATFGLERVFSNGWRIGAFATFTDVSAEDFGEGSFDKAITMTIPLDWVLGRSTKISEDLTIRPLTRDGGARLEVPGRLFETVEDGRRYRQEEQWGRLWR